MFLIMENILGALPTLMIFLTVFGLFKKTNKEKNKLKHIILVINLST